MRKLILGRGHYSFEEDEIKPTKKGLDLGRLRIFSV
jgi:hypothetical protein